MEAKLPSYHWLIVLLCILFCEVLNTKASSSLSWRTAFPEEGTETIQNNNNSSHNQFECPSPDQISPCLCSTSFGGSLECRGHDVTQDTVNNLFSQLRTVNNIATNDGQWLNLSRFTLVDTQMKEFDLTPLFKIRFSRYLDIWNNPQLWKISSKNQNGPTTAIIQVDKLMCTENVLTDEGLQDTLSHFEPYSLKKLTMGWNKIRGSQPTVVDDDDVMIHQEFLPGLSAFKNLEELELNHNLIRKIYGGQFSGNWGLRTLNLERNVIRELGKDAFFVEQRTLNKNFVTLLREINLSENRLKDDNIHHRSGIKGLNGPTKIKLNGNEFVFLSLENFEKFLKFHKDNAIEIWDNPIVCDLRMRWLKENKDEYEKRVRGVICRNDPKRTAFTTDSIY